MIIPNNKHIEFYEQQIEAQENDWKRYANTAMHILVQEKKMYYGEIWGVQKEQGNVILRFKSGQVPRIKQHYFMGIFGSDAPKDLMECTFSFNTFRNSLQPRYYSGVYAEIFTINYWKTEADWSYIIVSGFDLNLIQRIKLKFFDTKEVARIVVAKTDPPVDYLINLKEFVSNHPQNTILNLNLEVDEDSWKPINIDNSTDITKKIIDLIDQNTITVIQGPPGTGKSHMAAELCNYYSKNGDSVCVTALTNRALIEVVLKKGLNTALSEGIIYKTNLTSDENKLIPALKNADDIAPNQGEVLFSTYYKLSQHQAKLIGESKRFDLMIIEEASQAFLATIAMFSSIAIKVLIIGDHKQLTPIVLEGGKAQEIFPRIDGVINGLQTFAFNNNRISYRLTKTRRLTSSAAKLTGLFYNNSLMSISDIEGKTDFVSKYRDLFHHNGGITIAKLPDSKSGFTNQDIYRLIVAIANDIIAKNDKELALLTPYVDIETELYEQYNKISKNYKNITISTVHKIQGLTSDFSIVFLPLKGHDLNENLFNVSTSRAKQGTLIVTFNNITLSDSASIETKSLINQCTDVSALFLTLLIK